MKFNKLIILLIVTIGICYFSTVTSAENQRSESVMEYLNGFFSASTAKGKKTKERVAAAAVTTAKKTHKKKGKKFKHHKRSKKFNKMRFTQSRADNATAGGGAAGNSTGGAAGNASGGNNTNDTGMLENWLMISSPSFKNTARFPLITLPNGTQIEIQTDPEFYRLNTANCSGGIPPTDHYFWFRLVELNIYYSTTETDINILGALEIKFISDVTKPEDPIIKDGNQTFCFTITDTVMANWKLCAETYDIALKWVCRIKKELNMLDDLCMNYNTTNNVTIIEKTINQPIIIIPLPSRHCNDDWNYQQHGDDWECDCSEGKEQSPIDLPKKEEAIDSPVKPLFQYQEVSARFPFSTIDEQMEDGKELQIKLVDNALRIFHHSFGKVITLDGAVYFAEEVVIHTPAEHTIDGKKFDMEVQIVHYGQSKGDIAKQVLLCFVFEKKAGVYNQFIDDIDFFNLPNPISKEREIKNSLFIPKILYNSDTSDVAIMKPFSFYTYQGSLTFPPCTERTIIYVNSKPLRIGTTAIQLFQEALRIPDMVNQSGDVIVSNWVPESFRNVQELNGRPVFHYDHEKYCGPDPNPEPPKPTGHYEKVIKKFTQYFYVNGERPSGLPGAFVVSEKEAKGKDITHLK